MWTSQDAMDLQVPIPTIDLAVAMRDLSEFEKEREETSAFCHDPSAALMATARCSSRNCGARFMQG